MVSFRRVPYALAFERGRVQRELLVEATRGCSRIEDVDLATADAAVIARLRPLGDIV
jgi:kynurenine 3-monooxygenase